MSAALTVVGFDDPPPQRRRLPGRREQFVEAVTVAGATFTVAVGFDPTTGAPKELFLTGAKDGSEMAAILADASVVISVALQHGVPASALAHSISRLPAWPDAPADVLCHTEPASVIGAALDLLVRYENEGCA